jgi:hypothetical protein
MTAPTRIVAAARNAYKQRLGAAGADGYPESCYERPECHLVARRYPHHYHSEDSLGGAEVTARKSTEALPEKAGFFCELRPFAAETGNSSFDEQWPVWSVE